MPDISLVASGVEMCYNYILFYRTGSVTVFKKLNAYLLARPKLLLTMIWVFFALAFIPGVIIAAFFPSMGYFKFLGIIIVPALCALYLRVLYGKIREQKSKQAHAERAARQAQRHQHKKKK